MAESITCPNCGKKFQLNEAMTHQIEEKIRKNFDLELVKGKQEFERQLKQQRDKLEKERVDEKAKLLVDAKKRAESQLKLEMDDLKEQVDSKDKKLQEAQKKELSFIKRQRELEDREKSLKLEIERTLEKERKKIWEDASAKVADEHRLKELEKDKQLSDMKKQIEDLKRKAEQGSQQSQGEILEVEFESILRAAFPLDEIEPVAKGVKGADIVQRVMSQGGLTCGIILWEMKRTKNWSEGWIQKLKDNQRQAKADLAVILSETLPRELNRFGQLEGIWISDFQSGMGLATALRTQLVTVAQARAALSGKNEKLDSLYNYLSGPEFKHRVEAIIEAFLAMSEELEQERRAFEKIWSKRKNQLERVITNTSGMYGDFQGIIGKALPDIQVLALPSGE